MSLRNSNIQPAASIITQTIKDQRVNHQFQSFYNLYSNRISKQHQQYKKMDMLYNYKAKNNIKEEKKHDVQEEKVRKTRKDKEGRKYICGACKIGYLSYPALYLHIKNKHEGKTPEGTIRGESGRPKKRGRPRRNKNLQIYQRQFEKIQFPKQLTKLVAKDSLQIVQFQATQIRQDEAQSQISSKYFVCIVKSMKKVKSTKVYLLPINQTITTFLDNIKYFVNNQTLQSFQEIFIDLINFINQKYQIILKNYRNSCSYYINYEIEENQKYCEVERPFYVPLFAQKYINNQLKVQDQLQITLILDFCAWLYKQELTDMKISNEKEIISRN